MTQEEVNASLDKMLENPKSKTFLNHLVRAYLPTTNVVKVSQRPKGDFKCVLTRHALQSVSEVQKTIGDEKVQAFFIENLGKALSSKENSVGELEKLIGNKKLGFTGKDTTTFMTYESVQYLEQWVMNKTISGDKHINWLVAGIRRGNAIDKQDNKNNGSNSVKPKTATFSLADSSDALSKLKAQLESKGK